MASPQFSPPVNERADHIRTAATEDLRGGVQGLIDLQSRIPEKVAEVAGMLVELAAMVRQLDGPDLQRALKGASGLARLDLQAALSEAQVEANRTGWAIDENGFRNQYGRAHAEALVRQAGAPRPWQDVPESREALLVADAVEVLLGHKNSRVVGF